METASVSTDLYSQQEKQVSLSILKGESLRSCARRNGISEHKCRSIVNNYCSRSDHDLYSSLRWNKWENEENGISTIDKLVQCNTRKLMQLRKFGKYGLRKLNTSLAKFGFSIRE